MPVRKWGSEQLVNGIAMGDQKDPTVAALTNGGYVVAWEDDSANAHGAVWIQRYDAAGHAVGAVIAATNTDPSFGFQHPSLVGLANGGFALGVDQWRSASDVDPRAKIYDANGTLISQALTIDGSTDIADQIAIARNGTGTIVAWHDSDANNGDISARRLDAAGQPLGSVFTVHLPSMQSELHPDVVQLRDGDLAFVWTDGPSIKASVADSTGTLFATATVSDSPDAATYSPPHVTALENGGFVVTYTSRETVTDDLGGIRAAVFGWNGTRVGGSFQVNSTTLGSQVLPDVVATADGGFVVVWVADVLFAPNGSYAIRGQAFGPLGDRIGGEFTVSTGTVTGSAIDPPSVSAAALSDGRIVVTWEGTYAGGGDTTGSSIHSQIIDPRDGMVSGTGAADTLYGHDLVNDEITALGGADKLFGLGGSDALYGGDDGDTLDGGAGADLMYGGAGSDVYVLDSAGDVVDESGGGGVDTVQTSAFSINLTDTARFAGIENATLLGTQPFSLTGNALANVLTGNAGANLLDGGAGGDVMRGGAGNDNYVVDNAGDVVDETSNGGAGTDMVRSSVTFTLAAGVENLVLTGAAAISGTGNSIANSLDASQNSAANTLKALGGNDTYIIGVGDIVDESAAGSDGFDAVQSATVSIDFGDTVHFKGALETILLTGTTAQSATGNALTNVIYASTSSGANLMRGLAGNDIYVVGTGDTVDESVAGSDGIDLVQSSAISINFGDAVHFKGALENITLNGNSAISATGNALANTIDGSLNGGANLLRGLAGNDIYTVGAGDIVDESVAGSDGLDTVRSLDIAINLTDAAHYKGVLENIVLFGAAALSAVGNTGANTITGNTGANIIDGWLGKDVMTGLAGDDIFRFSAISHSGPGAAADAIVDFDDSGDDRIDLSAVFGGTLAYQGTAAITGLGQVNVSASGADVFVHVNVTGSVASDMDIRLAGTTLASMAASDFVL